MLYREYYREMIVLVSVIKYVSCTSWSYVEHEYIRMRKHEEYNALGKQQICESENVTECILLNCRVLKLWYSLTLGYLFFYVRVLKR